MREDKGKGKRRHRQRRIQNNWDSNLVVRLVGIAVTIDDTNGPCWGVHHGFLCVREIGPITHLVELLMNFLRRFLLPLCLGFVGFGFRGKHEFFTRCQRCPIGDDEPSVGEGVDTTSDGLETGFHICAQTLNHSLCQNGVALADHPHTVCPIRPMGPAPDPQRW